MLKQIDMMDCAGKTVAVVRKTWTHDPALVIVFTDGTFCQIEASCSYDSAELESTQRLTLRDLNSDHVLVGIATEAEVGAARAAEEAARVASLAERERREFERLRAKFGGQA